MSRPLALGLTVVCAAGPSGDCTRVTIPGDRAGLVIGRAGENIKQVERMTGTRVQLDRENPDPNTKVFLISGKPCL
jgi:transcription antitermination factor NusA-like protein